MTIILKKDEKVAAVIESLKAGFTDDEFIVQFCKMYPEVWKKIEKMYNDYNSKTKPGRPHSMPIPRQYLLNALTMYRKKTSYRLMVECPPPCGGCSCPAIG